MCAALQLTGDRLADTYRTTLAIKHGCDRVTLDRGFSIFPGLRPGNLLDN